jgi:hypothetical protein
MPSPSILKKFFSKYQTAPKTEFQTSLSEFPPGSNKESIDHEFIWNYGGNEIFIYGNWDDWKSGIPLKPRMSGVGHSVKIKLDPGKIWVFKYVVDGEWRCALELPLSKDDHGNVNNVLYPDDKKPQENNR